MSKTIMFMHIPKAAGSTLTGFFSSRFNEDELFISGSYGRTHIDDSMYFANLDPAEKAAYRYVAGHMEINAFLGVENKYSFTFLRSPVQRMISLYNYVCSNQNHHMNSFAHMHCKGVADFVEKARWDELHNGMTRRLLGVINVEMPLYDSRVVANAIGNLDAFFDFVGIQESFDKSFFLLADALGISIEEMGYTSRNIGSSGIKKINPLEFERVKKYNQMDYEVYNHAKGRLSTMAARLKKGQGKKDFKSFKRRLKTFAEVTNKAA